MTRPARRSRAAAAVPPAPVPVPAPAGSTPWITASELAWAVPQVVALRSARMLAAGVQPDARDQEEFTRMGIEKLDAWAESCGGVASQVWTEHQQWTTLLWQQWLNVFNTPWPQLTLVPAAVPTRIWGSLVEQTQRSVNNLAHSTLEPLHRRATANARRLFDEADSQSDC